ncbi:MAG: hypothetical protein PHX88_01480 [Methanoculleus horonobensis]|nr:hypothetical protein [Methanoculleus horonobensis]MDD4251524.1 hypothetical protein [Methanoculleus horonobensis]
MAVEKKVISLGVLTFWLFLVVFFMLLARSLNLEIFFVLWLIGILVVVVLVDPVFSRPRYLQWIRYIIAVGVAIFGYIVALKVVEIVLV